ncbi:MAG: pirin family protein [Planctomycetota bacterium]
MKLNRRNALSLTAAGLIHISSQSENALAEGVDRDRSADLLVRQAAERGHTDLGWLKSYHSFSFGGYYDQRRMGFRSLRVINDDKIAAGRGFPTHPHRDMEIISYVLDGALQHKDSTGKGAVITPDDIQMMSAGTGITHSEYNPSRTEGNHFLQIWIQPSMRGVQPRYSDGKVRADDTRNQWAPIVGPDGGKGTVSVYQDANIFATKLDARQTLDYTVEKGRHAWLQVARGSLTVNGTKLQAGDAIATSRATQLHAVAKEKTDALLFDLG